MGNDISCTEAVAIKNATFVQAVSTDEPAKVVEATLVENNSFDVANEFIKQKNQKTKEERIKEEEKST